MIRYDEDSVTFLIDHFRAFGFVTIPIFEVCESILKGQDDHSNEDFSLETSESEADEH